MIKGFPNPHNEVENILSERAQTPVRDAPITFINTDLSEDELLALYGQADVVVLPTRGEGLNLPAADSHKSFRARRVRNQKQQARVRSVSASHDAIAEPEGRS